MSSRLAFPLMTRDRDFYRTLGRLMGLVILQNVIAYSVNMADNLMLGGYSQDALSGAATVNQIQFMVQQLTLALGDSVVVIGSQFWGENRPGPIRRLTGIALIFGFLLGGGVFLWTTLDPRGLLTLFTKKESYISEGVRYLSLIRFTYPLYIVTTILLASLRTVKTVQIALWISVGSLLLDMGINELLIFGRFGLPELGIVGAAIGTLAARLFELLAVLVYMLWYDRKLRLFSENPFRIDRALLRRYGSILLPSALSNFLWSVATPVQTAILGRLSDDAIAANSVSGTLFQYLKIVVIGEASASSVVIGNAIGESRGDVRRVREYARTLQILYLLFGSLLGVLLFFLRIPLLRRYDLTPEALTMANQLLILLCFIFVGMAYQMPTSVGIIKGGGDVRFTMVLNLIGTWCIDLPLAFAAAFLWNLPIVWIVALLNADQIFKCLPIALRAASGRWIRRLTGE